MNSEQITAFFAGALELGDPDHRRCPADWGHYELELALRPNRQTGLSPLWPRLQAGDLLPTGNRADCDQHHVLGAVRRTNDE